MSDARSLEGDVAALQHLQDNVFEGMRVAEAVLLHHSKPDARLTAINFPSEEGLLREAADLLISWKTRAAAILRNLDAVTATANLQFERLFDGNAGRQTEGFLRRRVPYVQVPPEAIAADLAELLSVSAAFDRILREARPVLVAHHRGCEACVQQLMARRRQVDLDLDDVGRRIVSLKEQTHERQAIGYGNRAKVDPLSEGERRARALDRHAAGVRQETLQSEQQTLQRMISDDEDCVVALNAGIAAVNVIAVKLAVDIEQRVALLKAANVQSSNPATDFSAAAQALIAAYDADILAGHDLFKRKQSADAAFMRQLAASSPASELSETEADGAEIATESTSPI